MNNCVVGDVGKTKEGSCECTAKRDGTRDVTVTATGVREAAEGGGLCRC